MAKPKKEKFDPSSAEGKLVRIVNRGKDGYRRGGVKHKEGVVDHPAGTFDATQLEQLQNDPRLQVDLVDPPADEVKD